MMGRMRIQTNVHISIHHTQNYAEVGKQPFSLRRCRNSPYPAQAIGNKDVRRGSQERRLAECRGSR